MAGGEIFAALEKGTLDATEYSMPAIDEVLGFHKITKFNLFPGWHQVSTSTHFMVNLDLWKKMTITQAWGVFGHSLVDSERQRRNVASASE